MTPSLMLTAPKPWHPGFLEWARSKPIQANLADQGLGKGYMTLSWLGARGCKRILWLTVSPYVGGTLADIRRHSRYYATDSLALSGPVCSDPGTIHVLPYNRIHSMRSTLALMRDRFDAVVADESQCLKRIQAQRTKTAIKTLEGIPNRTILTGSAITNSIMDVWSQFLFLDGGKTFGRSYVGFRETYFYPAGFEWRPKPGAVDAIRAKMAPLSFWAKIEECIDLPPIYRREIPVLPSPKVKAIYDQLSEEFLAEVEGGTVSAMFVVAKLMKMAQMMSGMLVRDDGSSMRLSCPKLETFKALASHLFTQTQKIVVWCRFNFEVEDVSTALELSGVRVYKAAGLADPTADVAAFQTGPGPAALVATLAKGARALTFTAADTAIYYNRTASVEQRSQSIGRIRRIGSEKHKQLTYYDLYNAGTCEESDLCALSEKLQVGASVPDTSFLRAYLAGKLALISKDKLV